MRKFTEEEKEKIINTPITMECFDMTGFFNADTYTFTHSDCNSMWEDFIDYLEALRKDYLEGYAQYDEKYFTELVRLLPASYKVVKLWL